MLEEPKRTGYNVRVDTAILLSVILTVTYIIGWIYAYQYFGYFKLGLLQLQIPERDILMYGYEAMRQWWLLILVAVVFYIFVIVWFIVKKFASRYIRIVLPCVILTTVLLLFAMIDIIAIKKARCEYEILEQNRFRNLPNVAVKINDQPTGELDSYSSDVKKALISGGLKLLVQNDNSIWVIDPSSSPGASIASIQINKSQIQYIQIMP